MIVRRDRKDYGWYEVYLCGGRSSGQTTCTQSAVQRAAVDSAVLAYFERCRAFWKMGGERLDAWSKEVRAGLIPNFGANLRY